MKILFNLSGTARLLTVFATLFIAPSSINLGHCNAIGLLGAFIDNAVFRLDSKYVYTMWRFGDEIAITPIKGVF